MPASPTSKAPVQAPEAKAAEGGPEGALKRLGELGLQALPAIGSAIGFAGFVAVIGAAIEWIRFDAAHLPATQAVLAVPERELVIIGALALSTFVVGAVLAVLLVYVIDSRGDATPGTARGLVAVGVAEMVVTLFFIEVRHPWAYVLLVIWLAVIGIVSAFVVAAVMRNFTLRTQLKRMRKKVIKARAELETAEAKEAAAGAADQKLNTNATKQAREEAELGLLSAKRAWEGAIREWLTAANEIIAEPREADDALRGEAVHKGKIRAKMEAARKNIQGYLSEPPNGVALSASLDDAERKLGHAFRAVGDHLLARSGGVDRKFKAIANHLPLIGKAAKPVDGKPPISKLLIAIAGAGAVLALALIVGIVLVATEHAFSWIAVLLGVAAVLALMNLLVARATEKFAWYGVSVFFSVLLFGAALTIARTLHRPSVQPIALVRKGDDVGICGVYITQTNERVYIGRLARSGYRPGLIFWVPTSDVDLVDVGQLEPIDSKFPALAVAMLRQLYKDRAEEATQTLKNTTVTEVTSNAKAGETTTTTSETPPLRQVRPTTYPAEQGGPDCTSP